MIVLGTTLTDTSRAFGMKGQVDPVQRLISAATTWGSNPKKDAIYLNFTPAKNDGKTIYRLAVKEVPVDRFWRSASTTAKAIIKRTTWTPYSLNNTLLEEHGGSVAIRFGGCDGKIPNCLPIMQGWNYTVRLYRPRAAILNGNLKFPEPQPVAN